MDEYRFDNLARALGALRTRRHAIVSLGGVAALTTLGREHVSAKPVRKSCKKSQTRCGGRKCITLKKHPRHCGACNNACPTGAKCVNGQCARYRESSAMCGERQQLRRVWQGLLARYLLPHRSVRAALRTRFHSWPVAFPEAVFVDASGDVFAVDSDGNCVKRFAQSGTLKHTFGVCGSASGNGMHQLSAPEGVVAYSTNIIIADSANNRMQIFGPDDTAAWMTLSSGSGSGNNQVSRPFEMTRDKDGNIYLADSGNHRVTKFNASWARMMQFGTGVAGTSTLQLNGPKGAAVDRSGRVHVADTGNHRIQVFAPDGSFVRTFGSLGTAPGRLQFPDPAACVQPEHPP